jgi:hypothetical protein
MSLRAMAVSGLAVAGLLLTVPAAQAATPIQFQLTEAQLASRLARQTLSATGFPATINDTLATVSGTDVLFIDAAGAKHAPSNPSLPAALQHLVARVHSVTPRVPV